ncbi:Infection Response protein [Geranomyces variabilis]|uniref:Infection Response protein n=1 Tax=Geranomyces variabilis TaxID=109894 RepID=A0AAD5TE46_9FUNG|nr:Infection Response protein [Geranomyces variabilis]
MHQKAILFGDTTVARDILLETNPRAIKSPGAKTAGFSEHVWTTNRLEIVMRGNAMKFGQNEELKRVLLQSGNATMVEASPDDRIW